MDAIRRRITEEPVMTQALIQAAVAMGVGFGLNWTPEQIGLVLAFTAMLLSFIARQQVTPTATVEAQVDAEVEKALTAEAEPMTDEQRQIVNDLREIRDRLRAREMSRE
jgi:hypothetical protein